MTFRSRAGLDRLEFDPGGIPEVSGNRMARVAEEVRREVGDLLQHRLSDPRVTWVSVTRVEVSRDLSHAKLYVSRMGEGEALEEALVALEKAAPMLRRELGRRMRLRKVPELHFLPDVGLLHSLRVSEILSELDLGPEAEPVGNETDNETGNGNGIEAGIENQNERTEDPDRKDSTPPEESETPGAER